jgi:ribosomal protein L35
MKKKTHSATKKRFRKTGSKTNPKIVGRKSASSHLLTNKSKRQKKMQGTPVKMSGGDAKVIKKLLQ